MRLIFRLLCIVTGLIIGRATADPVLEPKQEIFEGFETTLQEKGSEFGLEQQYTNLTKNQGHTHATTLFANHHGARYGLYGELARVHSQERAYRFKAGFAFSMTDRISGKLEAGSSTKNKNIIPEKYGLSCNSIN